MLIDSPLQYGGKQLNSTNLGSLVSAAESYYYRHSDFQCDAPQLRSERLKASAELVFPQSCHTQFSNEMYCSFDGFHQDRISHTDVDKGDQCIATSQETPPRLLMVDWQRSLFDGACTPMTNGFLNDDCMPGWDSWIGLVSLAEAEGGHGLLCWVPGKLVEGVNDALTIDAAECMSWVRESEAGISVIGWGTCL